MGKRPLTDKDGEVRPLTATDMKAMRPTNAVDPGMVQAAEAHRRGPGRPFAAQPKAHISFRFAADVFQGIRASGRGYNARAEKVLREALTKGEI
jgi:uncharacterized protein (DUF4415 family)